MSNPLSHKARRVAAFGGAAISLMPILAIADGLVIDRIYDPYVQPLETEFEWRSVMQSDDELGDPQKHSFGVGRGLSDRWAAELYAIGTKTNGESISVDAFELEATWQLTEQGEYAFDWGMVLSSNAKPMKMCGRHRQRLLRRVISVDGPARQTPA
jgi:hypothetical protein